MELLSAWYDGELTDADAQTVSKLVDSDPLWSQAASELSALDNMLDSWQAPACSADLATRISQQVAQTRKPVVLRLARWIAPVAAAAAVVLAAVLFLHNPAGNSNQTTPVATQTESTIPEKIMEDSVGLFPQVSGNTVKDSVHEATGGSSLSGALHGGNRKWASLSKVQKHRETQNAVAFMKMTPAKRDEIIKKYIKSTTESQKANWVIVVSQSFNEKQKAELRKMTPDKRLKAFLKQRELLVKQGKITEAGE